MTSEGSLQRGGRGTQTPALKMKPREIAYLVPRAPKLSPKGYAQINDLWLDENHIVCIADRFTGGFYTLENPF